MPAVAVAFAWPWWVPVDGIQAWPCQPSEELVRRGYEAFARGDMATLRELFDPEIVWHFPGRSVLAGDHRGPDAVLGFLATTMELTAGRFRVEVHDVVADDRHAVGLHLATGERAGRSLEDREVLVVHVRDGKVVAAWQYLENQDTYDECFSWTQRSSRGRCWDSCSGMTAHDLVSTVQQGLGRSGWAAILASAAWLGAVQPGE